MQQAAVIGRTFSKCVLAEITHDRAGLDHRLLALRRLDLLVESADEPDDEFLFRHPLIQEAAYSTILHRRRREFHRGVGEALERLFEGRLDERAAMLGEHFARGNDPRGVSWFIRAAERALALSEPSIAIKAVDQAIASAQSLNIPLPAAGVVIRARTYETLGRYTLARQDLEQALRSARDEEDRETEWTVLINLGMTWAERDYGGAGRHFRKALARAEEIGDELRIAHSLNRLGNWHSNVGQPRVALEYHDKALAIFSRDDNPEGLAETFDLKGVASYLVGDMHDAASAISRALLLFEERDNRRGTRRWTGACRLSNWQRTFSTGSGLWPRSVRWATCCWTLETSRRHAATLRRRYRARARLALNTGSAPRRPCWPPPGLRLVTTSVPMSCWTASLTRTLPPRRSPSVTVSTGAPSCRWQWAMHGSR